MLSSFSIKTIKGSVQFAVKVSAGAKKTKFLGLHGNALKISVQSPPVDGKANKELVRFLADLFGVSKSKVCVIKGETSPRKVVSVPDVTEQEILEKLSALTCV